MATISDIPLHTFNMSALVKLGSISKGMHSVASGEIDTRYKIAEMCSYIKGLTTQHKVEKIAQLDESDKWLMFGHLSGRCNLVFPSFDPLALATTEIRAMNGVTRTIIKEWSEEDMSRTCQFTHMAPTCKEFYELLSDEWQCRYGFDYNEPAQGESVSYGWIVGGVYFNVLNYFHSTCQRTQSFEMGTTKQSPAFFLFDQDKAVLDSVLFYLLS